jgi:hypothetical protein
MLLPEIISYEYNFDCLRNSHKSLNIALVSTYNKLIEIYFSTLKPIKLIYSFKEELWSISTSTGVY